jgi:two-component system NarL family sensor kinase
VRPAITWTEGRNTVRSHRSPHERQLDTELLREARAYPERDELADGVPPRASEEALRAERRLIRLGLDLHDGPLQDVVALGLELRLLAEHLSPLLSDGDDGRRVLGRMDDLSARLFALENDLRELAHSAETPAIAARPFRGAVAEKLEEFERTTDVRVQGQLDGDFDELTPSQRIALLRILEEALANVRKHSGARNVSVAMAADEQAARAEIADDGQGFDVESALVRAARRGRLGLVGMAERVRLLGGHFDIHSRPGATRITVQLYR